MKRQPGNPSNMQKWNKTFGSKIKGGAARET